jgi:WD40 repeat protein
MTDRGKAMRRSLYWLVVALAIGMPCAARGEAPQVVRPSETLEPQPVEPGQKPPVITAVAIAPGGEHVATAGDDHVVRIWSSSSGQLLHVFKGHADWVRSLAFHPDGQVLASAGDDGTVAFWEYATGRKLDALPAHPQVIYSLAFSPDGSQLATVGFERSVRIYDFEQRKLIRQLDGPCDDLRCVAYSPDGRRLVAAGRNGIIRGWTVETGAVDLEIQAVRLGRLRALAWLPDGDKVVSAGENKLLSVWDAATGQSVARLHCQTGKLLSMVVCGESLIATGGSDNVIRVWNWRTQTEADALIGHTGSVASLAYDPSSNTVISGSFDTTVRVWRLKSDVGADTAGAEHKFNIR